MKRCCSIWFWQPVMLAIAPLLAHAAIVMPPYLQGMTASNVWVMVECDSDAAAVVEYGATGDYGQSAETAFVMPTSAKTYVHRVLLTGLRPATPYHYRARHGVAVAAAAVFRTAPPPGQPFRFAFTSDFQSTASSQDEIVTLLRNVHKPDFLLYGGDMANNGEKYRLWREHFFSKQRDLVSGTPFFGCVGNHDRWTANTRAFLQAPWPHGGNAEYYSFDYGAAHFLILNTQVNTDIRHSQARFARADLAATRQPWKVVAFHKPAYCAGSHGEDHDMAVMSREIFEPAGVDVVLTGHSHFYQHNLVNGVHHFVMGPAGGLLRAPQLAGYTLKTIAARSFGVFDVRADTLTLKVYGLENKLLDTIELHKPAQGGR